MSYSDYQVETAPTWLQRFWGAAWNYALGIAKDAWLASTKAAVKARFADFAPPDALRYLLGDYALDASYNELATTTRARLRGAWDTWQKAGTKAGLLAALRTAGYPNAEIVERLTVARWWGFRVVLKPPYVWDHLSAPRLIIGSGWCIGGGILTGVAPPGEAARILALIKKWKPAHQHLVHAAVVLDGPLIGGFTIGDGTELGGTALYWSE